MNAFHRPAALGAALLLSVLGGAAAAEPRTFASGVYSADQADVGEALYESHCATCHEPEYFEDVFRAWNGVPLDEFYGVMAATMPQSNPGSLVDAEYVRILGFILAENDFPAGDAPLSEYTRGFGEILVSAP